MISHQAMTTEVKICGLRSEPALDAALAGGADYIGFVFYQRSPRNIEPAAARALADKARGRAKIVALLVDPDDALLADVIETVAPDIVQLHGAETPERVAEIARRFGKPVMKAVAVATAADVTAAFGECRATRTMAALTAMIDTRPTHCSASPMPSPQYGFDGPTSTGMT